MELVHYSENIITAINPMTPKELQNGKPSGLWVSVEGEYDWKWWCEAEEYRPERLKNKHAVTLNDNHNVLMLDDIYAFTDTYSYLPDCYEMMPFMRNYFIDWEKVGNEYDGIIIAPYDWHARDEFMWYYTWDCASGCIWNKDAIKEIKLISVNE